MKKRVIALVVAILISGAMLACVGAYLKYEILEPLELAQDKNIIEIPFLILADEGLKYAIESALTPSVPATEPTEETDAPATSQPTEATTEPTETTEPATVPATTEPTVSPTTEPTVPATTEPTAPSTDGNLETEPHTHTYSSTVIPPDCTTNGYTLHQCACGAVYTDSEVPATGHSYYDTVNPPTCTTSGYTWHDCVTCGHGYASDWKEALGHSYTDVVVAPTPETTGYTEHTCTACGYAYRDRYTEWGSTESTAPSEETTAPTQPDETTAPTEPEPTEPVTTEPPETEPVTQPTTPPPSYSYPNHDFSAGAVPDSWYNNTLFIGDSRTVGLRDYARSGNADYFCGVGMTVFSIQKSTASDKNFSSQTLASLLSSRTYDKIFISLGINECGYATSSLISAYKDLISMIRSYQPNAKIILQGIMMVTEKYASGKSYFQPSHIQSINDRIEGLCDWSSTYYIDVNLYFTNADRYLYSDITGDGCHLYASYYRVWANWISFAVGKFGI